MSLINASHKEELRQAGWRTRGYLPHFDGRAIPQFITLHLADSIPRKVIDHWQRELRHVEEKEKQIVLQRGVEKYLDQRYGSCFIRNSEHFRNVVSYIENNPVKAGLCRKPKRLAFQQRLVSRARR